MSEIDNQNKPHRLDDEESRLFSPNFVGHKERRFDTLFPKKFPVNMNWTEKKETIKKVANSTSFFKKFFFFSLGFTVIAILIATAMFFFGGNVVSANNIDLTINGNSFTAGGEELPLQVNVANRNQTDLELTDLFVAYDKGSDTSSGAQHVNELNSLGTIVSGKTASKNIFVTLYGGEGSTQNIDFTLQYRLHGSDAIFVKKLTFPVTISSAPIALSVDMPKTLTPNQGLSFVVHVQSNSKKTIPSVLLHADYPTGFKFAFSNPVPGALNNIWSLGDLKPGEKRDITVSGIVYGQDGEDRSFHIAVGAASSADNTIIGLTYNSLAQSVSLVKPFISAAIAINNNSKDDVVPVKSASNVDVTISWANNLPTLITDAKIVVSIAGNAYDPTKISVSNGLYDDKKQTITWDKTTEPTLASIQPSANGEVSFSFYAPSLVTENGSVVASPYVNLSVSIDGKQSDLGGAVVKVTNFESKKAIIGSELGFSADAFYHLGQFENTGPVPPKAGEQTTYTITWTVTNSANTLSNARATAILPTYIDWGEQVYPQSENLTFDNTTRSVTWNIGQVLPATGYSGSTRKVSFQVKLNTVSSQIDTYPNLILDTSVSARDTYTGQNLNLAVPAITTELQNDTQFPQDGGKVTN